jgi:hypothetical protein
LLPAIAEMKKRIDHVEIYTNGVAEMPKQLVCSGLTKINISVTGLTNEVYKSFQGYGSSVDIELVKKNILCLLNYKKTGFIRHKNCFALYFDRGK